RLTTIVVGYGLGRAGFPDARFDLDQVDRERILVTHVEAGSALRVERCEVTLDWHRLPSLPVSRVHISGARVDLTSAPSESTTAPSEESPPSPSSFPLGLVPALELDDAEATVPTPLGPVVVAVDSRVEPENGAIDMHLDGKATGKTSKAAFAGEARL